MASHNPRRFQAQPHAGAAPRNSAPQPGRPGPSLVASGFTLIELLVAISIIALLISILLPALSRARQAAQTVSCQSNLRQFGIAMTAYANDHDGYYPVRPGQAMSNPPLALVRTLVHDGAGRLLGYLPSSATGPDDSPLLQCPADPNDYRQLLNTYPWSYGYRQSNNGSPVGGGGEPLRATRTEPDRAPNRWLITDSWTVTNPVSLAKLILPFEAGATTLGDSPYGYPDRLSFNSYWHADGSNLLYEDTHAEWNAYGRPAGRGRGD